MNRIIRSFHLLKASAKILRKNKRLMIFPILALVAVTLELGLFGAAAIGSLAAWLPKGEVLATMDAHLGDRGIWWASAGILFVIYLPLNFTIIFLNSAMIACALNHLEGEKTSIRGGLNMARSHFKQILLWSLFTGIVSSAIDCALRYIPGFGGKILALIGGATWSIATFFVVPILVFEKNGVIGSIKRSSYLLKKTWGEQISLNVGSGLLFAAVLLVGLLAILIAGLGLALIPHDPSSDSFAIMAVLVAMVMYSVMVTIVFDSLEKIIQTVLYSFAVTGMLPEEISPELLPQPKT